MITLMVSALYNIRKTIKMMPRLGAQIKLCRMASHALAYILWITSWIFSMFLTIFFANTGSKQPYYYLMWLVLALLGAASFTMFFMILWHLGTKDKI